MIVRELKRCQNRGALVAFLTLEAGEFVIHDCRAFSKSGRRWVALPSRQYTRGDGTTAYAPIVEFSSKEAQERFQAEALASIDRYEAGGAK